jgi:hypothetical protein
MVKLSEERFALDRIEELKSSEAEDQNHPCTAAEVKFRDRHVREGQARESWGGLVAQLKADCSKLDGRCELIYGADSSLELIGDGSPIRCSSFQFMPVGHYIRIDKSYSHDGVSRLRDGIEKIRLELQSDGSVAFATSRETYRVDQVSHYLIMQVLQERP